tara:strand:+ start:6991 stop:7383 length:393 start_codon:yes stop_codon:yes gene_type:complete
MNTLSKELTDLFVDDEKNSEMMHGDCRYDPSHPVYNYSGGYKVDERVQTGTREVSSGYGKELTTLGISFKEVDSYGGEDCGSEYWCVWEFTRGDEVARFKFEGWYASYDGATFEHVFEVKPVQKTITVWG